jgi:hypothetical protein
LAQCVEAKAAAHPFVRDFIAAAVASHLYRSKHYQRALEEIKQLETVTRKSAYLKANVERAIERERWQE